MRKAIPNLFAAAVLLATFLGPQFAAPLRAQGGKSSPMKLKVGDTAPDFSLKYFDGTDLKDISLSQYRGKKNVVLAFYIFAFTGG